MTESHVYYPNPMLQLVVPGVLTLLGLFLAGMLAYRDANLGPRDPNAAYRSGQLLAILSALVTAALFIVFLFFNPYGQGQQPTASTFNRMIHWIPISQLGYLVSAWLIGRAPRANNASR